MFIQLSCGGHTEIDAKRIDKILTYKDFVPLTAKQIKKVDSVRGEIGKDDIAHLSMFYKIKSHYYSSFNANLAECYADSLLNLFSDESVIMDHKKLYFHALLIKGDRLFFSEKYNQAVILFLKARTFSSKYLEECETRALYEKIGNVYYVQANYRKAASYYAQTVYSEFRCNREGNPSNKFYRIQAYLNNTGFCYELQNMLDSALFFYLKDKAYIDSSRRTLQIAGSALDDATAVVCDNLGSVYLKLGQLDKAEELLKQSLITPYTGNEGVRIAPFIKLGILYTQKKNGRLADQNFSRAEALLKKCPNDKYEARLAKGRAEYHAFLANKHVAYQWLSEYLRLKERLDITAEKLSSINIEKDLADVEQEFALRDLKRMDVIKNISLGFAAFLTLLLMLIAILIKRNYDQSKNNGKVISLKNQELQDSLLRLEVLNQNYARILRVMTHDLKNPLHGISGMCGLLVEDDKMPKSEKPTLNLIKESADNVLGLVNEMLDSSLFEVSNEKIKRENIDLQTLLHQCVSLLKLKAKEKQQSLTLTSTKEMIIHANKEKLWRLFNNIIVNAIKFSPLKTEIFVGIKELPRHVIVTIEDKGIGIPKKYEEKIYDVLTEAKRAGTEGEKAYGLGLSISKQIVEAHFGKIWHENNPKGGTTFFIQLPK